MLRSSNRPHPPRSPISPCPTACQPALDPDAAAQLPSQGSQRGSGGETRPLVSRVNQPHPRDNDHPERRQLSIVSAEELAEICRRKSGWRQ